LHRQDTASLEDTTRIADGLKDVWRLSCTGQIEEALSGGHRLLREATEIGDDRARADCFRHLGFCSLQLGLIDDGLDQARSAGLLYQSLGDLAGEALARALYAWLLIGRADSDLALDEALRALEAAERTSDLAVQAQALNAVGIVYCLIKQPDKALVFLEQAVAISRQRDDTMNLGRFLTNIALVQADRGITARERGDIDEFTLWLNRGIETGEAALALSQSCGDVWNERILLCNIAEYYCQAGDFGAAQRNLDTHDATIGPLGDRADAQYQFARGLVQLGMKHFDEAIASFEASLATERDGDIEQALQSCKLLSTAFEMAGRYQEALVAHKRYHALYIRMAEQAVQRRAQLAAIGVENNQLRAQAATLESEKRLLQHQTEQLARTVREDSLTKLPNRRHLEDDLAATMASAEPYVIAMIDVDHFKRINDTHSHVTGDEVLRQIATILRACCRDIDLPARYGGEEFAVLLRMPESLDSRKVCERIRSAIATHNWAERLHISKVTVSIGVASSQEAQTPDAVLMIADKRLYVAKARGRNRIIDRASDVAFPSP
jgi:diguanylate cyclase (GGDEF)-like protein